MVSRLVLTSVLKFPIMINSSPPEATYSPLTGIQFAVSASMLPEALETWGTYGRLEYPLLEYNTESLEK